jgi:hypothetical protein
MDSDGYGDADIPALLEAARADAADLRYSKARQRARAVLDLAGTDARYGEARTQAEAVLDQVGWTRRAGRKGHDDPAARRARRARLDAFLLGPGPEELERERRRREERQSRDRAAGEIHNAGRMGSEVEATTLRILARHPERISGRPQARKVVDRLERDADIARSIDNVEGEEEAKARIEEIRGMFAL